MTLYLDVIFFINLMFDLFLVMSVAVLLRRKTSFIKMLLAALFGSLSIFCLFISLNSLSLFLIKFLVSIGMVVISFGYKDLRFTLKNIFYLYISSIILGGFLYLLNIQFSYKNDGLIFYYNGLSINFILLIILGPIFIYLYVKEIKNFKDTYSNYYNIRIYYKKNCYSDYVAFLDTGNMLRDPYFNKMIILVRDEKIIPVKYLIVPVETVNGHSVLKCVNPYQVVIKNVGVLNNVLIGLIDYDIYIDGVDAIINNRIIKEIKK